MAIRPAQLIRYAALAGIMILGGCASDRVNGAWTWTPPARLDAGTVRANAGNAVIQPARGFRVVQASEFSPEYSRRDAQLGSGYTNPYQSWMGWPQDSRPSLDYQRTFRTSRSAEQYTSPRTEREHSSSRGYRYGARRRVR